MSDPEGGLFVHAVDRDAQRLRDHLASVDHTSDMPHCTAGCLTHQRPWIECVNERPTAVTIRARQLSGEHLGRQVQIDVGQKRYTGKFSGMWLPGETWTGPLALRINHAGGVDYFAADFDSPVVLLPEEGSE